MKTVFISLLLTISLTNCSCSNVKLRPEYKGVDPKIQGLVSEYKDLAKKQGIVFNHDVTVGFKDFNEGTVIGRCTYGWGFREIDLDRSFWDSSNTLEPEALVWHELSHCFCDRQHDYGDGKHYSSAADIDNGNFDRNKGYYPDGCALSIMTPVILEDWCLGVHYDAYVVEMFDRCEKY